MRVLIAGPPASGKSTTARHIAGAIDGDVIDFDLIATEMGSTASHAHPWKVKQAVRAEIERRLDVLPADAVVIRSAPTAEEREAIARRIEADRVIVLEVGDAEAKRRAASDGRPTWTADAIDRWWDLYEPTESDEVYIDGDVPAQPRRPGNNREEPAAMAGDDKKDPDDSAKDDDGKKDDDLGDSGKSALDKERKARRDAERRAREAEAKVKEQEDADKSAADQLAEVKADLVKERKRGDRLQVAIDKGLTTKQAKRLVGDTIEDLEADADEILETFGGGKPSSSESDDDDENDDDDRGKGDGAKRPPSRKPTADLKGGSDPNTQRRDDENDPAKLAESVPRL